MTTSICLINSESVDGFIPRSLPEDSLMMRSGSKLARALLMEYKWRNQYLITFIEECVHCLNAD
jgi:hypothetical protein